MAVLTDSVAISGTGSSSAGRDQGCVLRIPGTRSGLMARRSGPRRGLLATRQRSLRCSAALSRTGAAPAATEPGQERPLRAAELRRCRLAAAGTKRRSHPTRWSRTRRSRPPPRPHPALPESGAAPRPAPPLHRPEVECAPEAKLLRALPLRLRAHAPRARRQHVGWSAPPTPHPAFCRQGLSEAELVGSV